MENIRLHFMREKKPVWQVTRFWNDATEEERTQANLRSMFSDEVVLDFESEDALNAGRIRLRGDGMAFLVAASPRGGHIHLTFPELRSYEKQMRNSIRMALIRHYRADEKKASEDTFISIPGKIHWKTADFLSSVDRTDAMGENRLPEWACNGLPMKPVMVSELLKGVGEGGRDDAAIKLATWHRTQKKTRTETLEAMLEWDRRNLPPLEAATIRAKVESAFRSEKPYGWNFVEKDVPLREIYDGIISILDDYMDLPANQKVIVALWIMGAAVKDCFPTFPMLYLNASRASGKTRLLKIIHELLPDSLLTVSLTEASLFRTPAALGIKTLLLDEIEGITRKGSENLRDLLNSCYKRDGAVVIRQRKDKTTGNYEVESFNLYLAVAMANITGMGSVLESRAITIPLLRSDSWKITKRTEFFSLDKRFVHLSQCLRATLPLHFRTFDVSTFYSDIQSHIETLSGGSGICGNSGICGISGIIERYFSSSLKGRDAELWLPLLIIAEQVEMDILPIAEQNVVERAETDTTEDADTLFLDFLTKRQDVYGEWLFIRQLRDDFHEGEGTAKNEWPSNDWIGRALRRMRIVKGRRRQTSGGREVLLDWIAIEKRAAVMLPPKRQEEQKKED